MQHKDETANPAHRQHVQSETDEFGIYCNGRRPIEH